MAEHKTDIQYWGAPLAAAEKVIIMVHGRGGTASDLVNSLMSLLHLDRFAVLAPQATNNTWYPYSFLAPLQQNEPWLSSALALINKTVDLVGNEKIPLKDLYFLGFSQGACLMLEYITRKATCYGGAFAYSGGLIGDKIYPHHYEGDFGGTPVLLGCSDVDPHIPLQRVYATENIMRDKGATVHVRIYPGMGHTINQDEILFTNEVLSQAQHSEDPV